jgi:hypothetical protein
MLQILKQKHRFLGLNLDDDPRDLKEGDYRYALNCRVGSSDSDTRGVVENIKGNALVSISLPAGTNKVIGTYEDRIGSSVFYFLYNSGGSHGIYRYLLSSNSITKIFEWSGLNFNTNYLITGVELVDNMLYWVDGLNPSRKINITDAPTYPQPYVEAYINHIKVPPLYPPVATASLLNPLRVLTEDKTFVFSMRYVYSDFERSVFSPFSKMVVTGYQSAKKDTITLDLTAGGNNIELTDTGGTGSVNRYSSIISHVEVLFRDSPTGPFKLARKIPFADVIADPTFVFKNDESYPVISLTESVKLYDAIPREPKAMGIIKGRMYLENYKEGFPEYSLDITRNSDTYTTLTSGHLNRSFLKNDSRYQYGVVFKDFAGRRSGVYSTIGLKVYSENKFAKQFITVSFDINGTPPDWATSYEIVRTDNLTTNFFVQARVERVYYAGGFDNNGDPIYSTPGPTTGVDNTSEGRGPGRASELHILLNNFQRYGTDVAYIFTEGDKLSFLTRGGNGGAPSGSPEPGYDTPDVNANLRNLKITRAFDDTVVVDYTRGLTPLLNRGAIVEIYRERDNSAPLVFYEIGESHPITNPGTPSRAFSQTSFTFSDGDVHFIEKEFAISDYIGDPIQLTTYLFSMNPNRKDIDGVWENGLGQPNVVLDVEKEQHKTTGIRISNQYIQSTNINGLSSFEALNEKILPSEYGPGCKLQVASNNTSESNVLLSIHSREIVSLYIEEAIFSDVAGQTTVAISDKIIGAARALRGGYGSINPESIVQQDGKVFGWDANKGVVWRYSQDGLTPISDYNCRNFFYNKSQLLLSNKENEKIYGCFDPYFMEYILCFSDSTISFSEPLNKWTTYYSFLPEFIEKVNTKMVSFKDGALYVHGANSTYNNFYGVQYNSQLKFISNESPSVPKLFRNHAAEGSLWYAKEMDTPEGQHTELLTTDYENRENVWYAVIMRDMNTVGLTGHRIGHEIVFGDIMRSAWMSTLLENTSTEKATLFAATCGYELSKGHKV